MKKKLFVVMMAIVAMFATSCQEDVDFVANTDETSVVSFNLSTPEISTRAYGDGTNATVLQYAVYDAAGNELRDLTKTDGTINISTTVNLQLTTGNTYSIIFWAAAPNAPYEVNFANKEMTVDYDNVVSNSENYDAFYAYHTFEVKSNKQTETVKLMRPFAQLNIGTSDYAISQKAGYVPTKSSVTVKQVYSTLDLENGAVSNPIDAVFKMNAIDRNETFPVAGNEYLAMAYLLVPADNNIVDVDFTYADDSDNAKTREVTAVPVKRNYRTNIFGEILTSNVSINVNIEPQFVGNVVKVSTWDEFTAALADGNSIMLAENISYNNSYTILNSVTIDLNGKTLEITDPTKRINIGNKNDKNAPKPNVTIKNGNLHSKVYAQTGNVVLSDIKFGGVIAYTGDAQGVITVGPANLLAERCDMANVKANAAETRPRALNTEGLSNGYLKLKDCNFPAASDKNTSFTATKLLRTYINPLSGDAKLEITNCKFGVAANIQLAASYVWSNLNLTGCSGGFTFNIARTSTSLTEEELVVYRAIKQNNSGDKRFIFSDGEINNL